MDSLKIKSIFFSPYVLKAPTSLNSLQSSGSAGSSREGVLLRIDFADGLVGYSDLCPFALFQDPSLESCVQTLRNLILQRNGEVSFLENSKELANVIQKSIWFAYQDAKARASRKSLFDLSDFQFDSIENHALVTDCLLIKNSELEDLATQKFSTLKIKLGRDLKLETDRINFISENFNFKLRFDFNAKISGSMFGLFLSKLSRKSRSAIEFVEDAFPYSHIDWQMANIESPLALDFVSSDSNLVSLDSRFEAAADGACDFVIFKPARDFFSNSQSLDLFSRKSKPQMITTSYMDHPVGIAFALYELQMILQQSKISPASIAPAGLLTFRQFEPNIFVDYFVNNFANPTDVLQSCLLAGTRGTGIGFDEALMRQSWVRLK